MIASHNGIDWIPVPSGVNDDLYDIVKAGDQIVVVGAGLALTSPNGTVWTRRPLGSIDTLTSVVWTGSSLVAAGFDRAIYSSDSGITWTPQSSGYLDWMYGITQYNNKVIVVGYNYSAYNCYGTVLTSPNGVEWTRNFSGSTKEVLYAIDTTEGNLIAVGYQGIILASPDAAVWTPCSSSGMTRNLFSITHSPMQFVTVGARGTILVSQRSISNTIHPKASIAISKRSKEIYNVRISRNQMSFSWNHENASLMTTSLMDLSGRLFFTTANKSEPSGHCTISFYMPIAPGRYFLVNTIAGVSYVSQQVVIR